MVNKIRTVSNFLLFYIQISSPFIFLVLFNISFICSKNLVFIFRLLGCIFVFLLIFSSIVVRKHINILAKRDIGTILKEKYGNKLLQITSLITVISFLIAFFTSLLFKLFPKNYLIYALIILSWGILIFSLKYGAREQFLILHNKKSRP